MASHFKGLPRIDDVARVAGVSPMSVSRALRNAPGVSDATRERILSIAQELGYERSTVASNLAGERSTLIGISVPTLFDAVFAEILDGMRPILDRRGFQTVVHTSGYDEIREAEWLDQIVAWRPAGIVMTGVDHSLSIRTRLRRADVPTLEIWDVTDDPIDICVGLDHIEAGRSMAAHLAALGYRRPAYVGFSGALDQRGGKRFQGFRDHFVAVGGALSAAYVTEDNASFQAGYQGASEVLSSKPDLIYFLNDHMAFGGMMACHSAGLDVPGDIGVAGFNDLNINIVLPQSITTSRSPRQEIGKQGASALINRIAGAEVPRCARLSCVVIPGATTQAV